MSDKRIPRAERKAIIAKRRERKRAERAWAGTSKLTKRARRQAQAR